MCAPDFGSYIVCISASTCQAKLHQQYHFMADNLLHCVLWDALEGGEPGGESDVTNTQKNSVLEDRFSQNSRITNGFKVV